MSSPKKRRVEETSAAPPSTTQDEILTKVPEKEPTEGTLAEIPFHNSNKARSKDNKAVDIKPKSAKKPSSISTSAPLPSITSFFLKKMAPPTATMKTTTEVTQEENTGSG